jgi:hypothetical protein
MGSDLAPAAIFLDTDGLQDLDVFPRLRELTQTHLIDSRYERRRTAVHDGYFLAVDLDVAVVDRKSAQRGKKVLYSADTGPSFIPDDSTKRQVLDEADICRNFSNNSATFIAYEKFQPGIRSRWVQDH